MKQVEPMLYQDDESIEGTDIYLEIIGGETKFSIITNKNKTLKDMNINRFSQLKLSSRMISLISDENYKTVFNDRFVSLEGKKNVDVKELKELICKKYSDMRYFSLYRNQKFLESDEKINNNENLIVSPL